MVLMLIEKEPAFHFKYWMLTSELLVPFWTCLVWRGLWSGIEPVTSCT